MIRSAASNIVLLAFGVVFVVYAISAGLIASAHNQLTNSGVFHCIIVGSLGLWMAIGAIHNLRKSPRIDQPTSRWDRYAGTLLAAVAIFGGLTWISWFLGAPRALLFVFWIPFLCCFGAMFVLIAGYAIDKSSRT